LIAVGPKDERRASQAQLDRLAEDMQCFGATEAQIAAALAELAPPRSAPAAFRVHPDNHTAVRLFLGMATQWNAVALSTLDRAVIRRTGLRYEVLDLVARGLGLAVRRTDFSHIQEMEAEALTAWAEAAA
jgi:hypothetical protein